MMRILRLTPLLISLAPLYADELKLDDGGTLTGEVLRLKVGGILEVAVPIAGKPLILRADHVKSVRFKKSGDSPADHDARITLANGDLLPCDILGINQDEIRVATDFAGEFSIKREWVSSAQVGIRPRRSIYQGPRNLEDWKVDDNWHFDDGALVSEGSGSISREFKKLPESHSLGFTLGWATQPNLQVYFCSENKKPGGGKHDRYYLQFGSAGFELKRQSTGDPTYQTLGKVPRSPASFPDRRVSIELRVDRTRKLILLYLDGKLEGRFNDPLPNLPTGNTTIFLSNLNKGQGHRVSEIAVREWHSVSDRHQSEDRGEGDGDALIDHEGDRYSGKLIDTFKRDGNIVIRFKNPHQPKALEIPLDMVSTLFFGQAVEDVDESPLSLGLIGGGSLSAGDCQFLKDKVEVVHPLLGSLSLTRSKVRSMQQRKVSEEAGQEEETPSDEEE